jgi:hypothetical protein
MSEQPFIVFKGSWQGTSNITSLIALYSIKNRKFIKGYLKGYAGKGEIIYRILPGTYVYFFYFGWSKNDPPREVEVELLQISQQGKQTLAKVVVKFYNGEFLKQFPPQLFDFYKAIPPYHGYPSLNFEKVYAEEENNTLIEFIKNQGEYIEGEEHE